MLKAAFCILWRSRAAIYLGVSAGPLPKVMVAVVGWQFLIRCAAHTRIHTPTPRTLFHTLSSMGLGRAAGSGGVLVEHRAPSDFICCCSARLLLRWRCARGTALREWNVCNVIMNIRITHSPTLAILIHSRVWAHEGITYSWCSYITWIYYAVAKHTRALIIGGTLIYLGNQVPTLRAHHTE